MDDKNFKKEMASDIPKQIFGKFLEELKSAEIPVETIERLEIVLLKKETPNEGDIKTALFFDTQII